MNKSTTQSSEEASRLAAAIETAKSSLRSSSMAAVSASQPFSESLPSETQRIGTLVMPRWMWSAVWTHSANAVRLQLGGEIIEVQARGQWEPPPPNESQPLPQPRKEESYQNYYLRVLDLYRGQPRGPEITAWMGTRRWVGERANALREAIARGQDLPGHQWMFVTEKPR